MADELISGGGGRAMKWNRVKNKIIASEYFFLLTGSLLMGDPFVPLWIRAGPAADFPTGDRALPEEVCRIRIQPRGKF